MGLKGILCRSVFTWEKFLFVRNNSHKIALAYLALFFSLAVGVVCYKVCHSTDDYILYCK